ncbi:hypothetical protein BC937DRAFT_92388 [Endogone sp. FLAS-F59071]|nr:hypothetical protein BC937DRAFT_92388 [Endogone sp. FLAS-F59071]|eukprot:RUS15482.1 hypothetical protein BC937DRAFT_92388 [Endogone sp. FLAS-F59071]
MKKGLEKDDQSLKMLPTYVTGMGGHCYDNMLYSGLFDPITSAILPAKRRGLIWRWKISGMDVYVCQVKMKGERGILSINQYQYRIPDELAIGEDASVLLDYLTDCVADFLSRVASQDLFVYSMRLSFGFPVQQLGLNKGKMLEWGHGFNYSNVSGQDIMELLHQSFRKKGLATPYAHCTLLAHAYQHPSTRISVLHGAGTNCAYYETRSNIPKLASPSAYLDHLHTIVNTEWGGFDDDLRKRLPLTSYDRKLDRESNNTHVQIFEKMASGMYLSEIVRIIVLQFIDSDLLFSAESSVELNTPYAFNTNYIYVCEADATDELEDMQTVLLKVLNVQNSTHGDREVLKKICEIVGNRSARLLATMLAAISTHTIKNGLAVN